MYYPTRYSSYNPVYPIYADELYHHGIKGQRWGHRNGPPYPLNAQTHAAVVRSAGSGGRIGGAYSPREAAAENAKKARVHSVLSGVLAADLGLGAIRNAAAARSGSQYMRTAKALSNSKGARAIALGAAGVGAGASALLARRAIRKAKEAKEAKDFAFGNRRHVGSSNAVSDAEKKAKRKKMLRNIAIGAGGAALAGGAAYALAKKGGYNYQSRGMLNGKPAVGLGRHLATEGKRVAKYAGAGAKSMIPKKASRTAIVPYSGGSVPAIRSAANKVNRKAIARNIAIGTGAAAGLGGAIYGGSKIRNNLKRAGDTSWVRRRKRRRR